MIHRRRGKGNRGGYLTMQTSRSLCVFQSFNPGQNQQCLLCNLAGTGLRSLIGSGSSGNVSRDGLLDSSRVATSGGGGDEGVG